MQTLKTGDKVADRYLLQEQIGKGRMSSVYKALDMAASNAIVAVKLLDTQHPDRIKQEFFKRETTALKQLRHPNIVSLQQSSWSDDGECFYLILDHLPYSLDRYLRGDLDTNLENFNPYRTIRELAGAVAYAHAHDVIHRDIKPSNILIDETGRPCLADFGISKLLDQLTIGETLAGFWSGGYASPEQRTSKPVGLESDVYSLGAVFYHILSGQAPPPEGPTPDLVDSNCGATPIQLRRVLRGMLAESPKNREYSGSNLVASLEAITRQMESLPQCPLILTNRAISDLRMNGYIQNEDLSLAAQVIRENLSGSPSSEVHIHRDRQDRDTLRILGDSLRLICALGVDDIAPVVKTIHAPYLPELEREREQAMPYRAIWEPTQGNALTFDNKDRADLLAQLDAHESSLTSAREQRSSRKDFIQRWLDILSKQQQVAEDSGLEYANVEEEGEYLIFTLTEQFPDNLQWAEDTPLVVATTVQQSDERQRPVQTGNLVEIDGLTVEVAKPNRRFSKSDIPQKGKLALDPVQARSANKRQRDAAFNFLNGEMVNPKIADVVADPSQATRMPEPALDFYQDWLSEDKKSAVRRAVSSNEMFLIQGPPGTGKTAVIAEIVLQILKQNPDARILLSSQSNVAVDHALTQVARAAGDYVPELVRLGRSEKISLDGDSWTIQQRAEALRREALGKCKEVINELKQSADSGLDRNQLSLDILNDWIKIVGRTDDFMKLVVEQSNVVGATCLYSGGRRMPEANFDWAIIDEAGRATVPETLVPMVKAEKAILVGDEHQLPPMIDDVADLEDTHEFEGEQLDKSLFQSLVEEMDAQHIATLNTQYRMHPAIGNLISKVFYEGDINQGTKAESYQSYDGWTPKPVVWLSTSASPDHREIRRGSSFTNNVEAGLINKKLQELENFCRQHELQRVVGVISGYSAQVGQLHRIVDPGNEAKWRQLKIEIATVDSFQGRECDVVIYSTVRSNRERRIGFLKDHRRVNVALSRARDSLVIVGDDLMMRNATMSLDENPFAAVFEHISTNPDDCIVVPYTSP